VMSVKKERLEEKFFFMFNKSLNIPNSISINFLVLNNSTRFLILKNNSGVNKYIKIPNFITVNKNKQILNFKYTKESQTSKFFRTFFTIYQELKYKIFETIIIRGVGLRVTLIDKPSAFLELKLGYSHQILLAIPESLNVIVKKKKLLVEGSDKVLVGNFVNKIINFKSLNNYTGKGLWLKSYQKFILKEIKKI
jgi:ribosomal protein L6P/L9E